MLRHAFIVWVFSLTATLTASADVITQWTFNDTPNDNAANSGTLSPESGSGTVSVLTTNDSFAQGSGNDLSSTGSGNNNSSWNTSGYPPHDQDNKSAGIQIAVNTTGYQDIILTFEHRHNGAASRSFRIQYSSNGTTYTDGLGYSASTSGDFHSRTQDMSSVSAMDNNPNARFRVVAEFEGFSYAGTSSSYMSNADNRFDLITVSGTLIPEPCGAAFLTIGGLLLLRRRPATTAR